MDIDDYGEPENPETVFLKKFGMNPEEA